VILDGFVNLRRPDIESVVGAELSAVSNFFGESPEVIYGKSTADGLFAALDEAGVDGGILTAMLPFRRDGLVTTIGHLQDATTLLDETDRLRLTVYVPGYREVTATCRMLRELATDPRVVGCGVSGGALGIDLTDRRLYPVYATLAEVGLPLVANVGIFGPPRPSRHQHPMLLEEIMCDIPELKVVACHMGHPWEQLLIRLMMKFPQLYLMTSAYLPKYMDPALVRFMQSARGIEKVIWASDFPMIMPKRSLTEARKLSLDQHALDNFLGDNLIRVFGW
jgi:uncharacterized protein